ncbi:hypothetical protein HJFPF1_05454 [Paramyrothecium foliicola]|nr:hypothetical protein HJFPF1_05454 [Paramyrothecium foliicola]
MNAIPPRHLEINKTALSHHYDVLLPDGNIAYFADISMSPPEVPALTLFAGSTRNTPNVAACHMPAGTGDMRIDLIDPDTRQVLQQEDLTKESMYASKYRFMTTAPSLHRCAPESPLRELRSFVWKRTHKVGVNGMKLRRASSRNWKLIDEVTQELLAVFTNEWSLIRCGILQINVDWGTEFDVMVLITCLSMYEKSRRRRQKGSKSKQPLGTHVGCAS